MPNKKEPTTITFSGYLDLNKNSSFCSRILNLVVALGRQKFISSAGRAAAAAPSNIDDAGRPANAATTGNAAADDAYDAAAAGNDDDEALASARALLSLLERRLADPSPPLKMR